MILRKLTRALLATLLLPIVCHTLGAAPQAQAPFRFAWLSDTHVGSSSAEADLRASVQDINSQTGLSFVVLSGDVTEYGSLEQLTLARSILGNLKIPCHVIPGNHDTKWSESGATDFPRLWGADRFSFEYGGCRFIGIHQGPLMKMGDGHWAPQDVRWLKQTLAAMPDARQPLFFITHYPIDQQIANWQEVLDLLKQYNVQAVLCGHGHANRALDFEGVPGVMGRSNLRARKPVGGYNVVEIAGDQMICAERAPGGDEQAPWHRVALGLRKFSSPGQSPPRPDYSVNNQFAGVRAKWVKETGFTIASSPAVYQDLAIVGDASGTIHAWDIGSGQAAWTFRASNAVYSTPAVSGKTVVVPSTDGAVYALNATKGNPLWKRQTDRPIVASPVIANQVVFQGSSDGRFRALDLETGRTIWEYADLKGFVEAKPLVYAGKVIFGAWDSHLYALDAKTGELAWKWKGDKAGTLLSPAACTPVGARDKVFIVAPDRQMTALRVSDGQTVWRTGDFTVRESIGPSTDDVRFYVRSMNDYFYAFRTDADTPVKVWELNAGFGYDINSAMLAEKSGVVFYGTKNGLLFALEGKTGKVRWQHKLGNGVMNTPVPLSDRAVLVSNFDGQVALIEQIGPS